MTTILSDGEGALAACKSNLECRGVVINVTSKNEHVSEVECAGRSLKERARAIWSTLPYKLLKGLLVYMVYYCFTMINMFLKGVLSIYHP